MDIRLALICGIDIPFPQAGLTIHQPKLSEIAFIGEDDFFTGAQYFCIEKTMITQDKSLLSQLNNFQVFMTIMGEPEMKDKKEAVIKFLSIFFPSYKVSITPRALMFMNKDANVMIDEQYFEQLQQLIGEICCLNSDSSNNKSFNPADEQARKIAEKIMKARQKVAAEKKEGNGSIFAQYMSVLGCSVCSLLDTNNFTIYQLYDQVERYTLYTNWKIDVDSRLAGAKSDSAPENWMKNIH